MRNYRLQGIILRHRDQGEADRVLIVFSQERGKVELIAKGVRWAKSRLGGSLQPFLQVRLEIAEGKMRDVITGVHVIKSYEVSDDVSLYGAVSAMAEAVDQLEPLDQDNPKVFSLIERHLESSRGADADRQTLLLMAFLLQLLSLHGLRPELDKCVRCGSKLSEDKNYYSVYQGGVMCGKCKAGGLAGQLIQPDSIKTLRFFLSQSWEEIARLRVKEETITEIRRIVSRLITQAIDRPLQASDFIRQTN